MNGNILVVEDNPDNMKLIEWTLEDADYGFTGAESAERALALLEQRDFDLVLMDVSLPGIDGKEATRRLRKDPRFASLPVVAVTAHAIKSEEQAIRDSGVDELLTKPIDECQLLDTVARLLCEERRDGEDLGCR